MPAAPIEQKPSVKNKIVYLPIARIAATELRGGPEAGRFIYDLTSSVRRYGIITPVCVRRAPLALPPKFELVSGRRRLQAARLAGLSEIAAIILDISDEEAAAISVIENLQRYSPDFTEEAAAIDELRSRFGYSQEQTAALLGLSQSAVANKLRLLRLPDDCLATIRDAGLSERHARELLRLPENKLRSEVLSVMITRDLTVAESETLIDKILEHISKPDSTGEPASQTDGENEDKYNPEYAEDFARDTAELLGFFEPEPEPQQKLAFAQINPQFYINTIEQGAETMRKAGFWVEVSRRARGDEEEEITVRIRRPSV
ncbi:MAG: ParB/RepB/Spo0J family partition protein [Oscillospiraceae bacterium]|jgi:ParB family chromosome partitioning protein|nr:ParB/RepB/Spo0J family partition protein [Oscillospiraceae bacterium]